MATPSVQITAKKYGIKTEELLKYLDEVGEQGLAAKSPVLPIAIKKVIEKFNLKEVEVKKDKPKKETPKKEETEFVAPSPKKFAPEPKEKGPQLPPLPEHLREKTKEVFKQEEEEKEKKQQRAMPSPMMMAGIPKPRPQAVGHNPFASRNGRAVPKFAKTGDPKRPFTTKTGTTPDKPGQKGKPGAPFTPKPGGVVVPARGKGRGGKGAAQRGSVGGAFGRSGANIKGKKKTNKKYIDADVPQIRQVAGYSVEDGGGKIVKLFPGATIQDLAEKINVDSTTLIAIMFKLGEMVTQNQSLDDDTFKILGEEIGYEIQTSSMQEEDEQLLDSFGVETEYEIEEIPEEDLVVRPPVVTVMGHVDHGKTKLLDTIKGTKVIEGEAGGITQKIGAYRKTVHIGKEDRYITFIDTPGHEAFTQMRARGAEITDVAILVVAADDGVMPTTIEALNHAKSAGVPIVVAVNKIDKEGADPEKVRAELTEFGLVDEKWGGDTIFVDISARNGTNIEELLESVLLTADATVELRANKNIPAIGTVVESHLDKGRGPVATVLVQNGTLKTGDPIVVGTSYGRVRALSDEWGTVHKTAGPSIPATVLGLTSVPGAGDQLLAVEDERTARQIAEKREATKRNAELARRRSRISLDEFNSAVSESKLDALKLIIKGDSSGSVEALEEAIFNLDIPEELRIDVIHRAVGDITQNDINLASVDNALIIAFDVKTNASIKKEANNAGIEIRSYNIIYRVTEDIEAALKGMLKPIYEEVEVGSMKVLDLFKSTKVGEIAGCKVDTGIVKKNLKAQVLRNEKVISEEGVMISTLKRFKDDVSEVKAGFECGISLDGFEGLEIDDKIVVFDKVEIERK